MFNTLGERISYCRNLLGLARNDMVEKIGGSISLPTLARWELNTVLPSPKKIEILSSFFINHGINVSLEWLKTGKGYPPINLDLQKFEHFQFDELTYTTFLNIRNQVKDFYFQQVNSNFFRPIISFGDYVGGIFENNKKLLDKKLCFLFSNSISIAGIYNFDENILLNFNQEVQKISSFHNNIQIGEIQWIARRP